VVSEFLVSLANGKSFGANGQISLLDAAQAAGLNLEHGCRTGRCGQCKTHVLQGRTQRIAADLCLSDAERSQGWVLTCADAAGSDVALDSEDLAELEGITARTLPARIHELQPLSEDVLRVVLRLPPRSGLRYLAGQYVNIIGAGGLRRSYSMANAPQGDDRLEFFIRRVPGGEMSDYWFQRAALGDLLRIDGPRGSFYLRQPAGRDLVLLATGTGIAPIKAMLETLASAQPRSVRLLWGGRTQSDLFWKPAFADLPLKSTRPCSHARAATGPARAATCSRCCCKARPDLAQTDVYACGSSAMLASAQAALLAAGLPPQRFHADAFVSSASPAEPGAKREQRPQPQAETTTP
jgi:CDP-4-dehydro-6-deoxyglucose reductase